MTITTTAPHGRTLEALSRVAVLLTEHREEIPPVYVSVTRGGSVSLQVTAVDTFDEATRRAAVEFVARTLHLDPPRVDHETGHYRTESRHAGWIVFTSVRDRCPTCARPVVR